MVFGTRPEAVKMAPLVHALKRCPADFSVRVCVTAQHRQMLDQVLATFGIEPDIDLDVMSGVQDLSQITAAILTRLRSVFADERPDAVLVHGDTASTFAAAVGAFYAGIPVGHVEAGLRTYDLSAPFPEEFNRQVTTKASRWHFAPTDRSRRNLIAEGVRAESISVTGNTVIDALDMVLGRITGNAIHRMQLELVLDKILNFDWKDGKIVLVTGHRRENFGKGLLEICGALRVLASMFPSVNFVYPVHLNPNVRHPVHDLLGGINNIFLVAPMDYEAFIYLLSRATLVLTDSGGIQEEAPSFGKPVLVMRDTTERPEGCEAGILQLVGTDAGRIVAGVSRLLEDEAYYLEISQIKNPFGDGRACERIVDVLRAEKF